MKDNQLGVPETIIRSRLGSDRADYLLDIITRELSPSDLTALLLLVFERIVKQRSATDVFWQYCQNCALQPSTAQQHDLLVLDQLLFDVVGDRFEAIDLSPVAPLGINSILANTSQNNVLSTVRNTEVAADVTTSLAIEAARRRKARLKIDSRSADEVNLCASQRSIRMQNFDEIPGFTSHFRIFGAVSAGRDTGDRNFEVKNLVNHLSYCLDFLIRTKQAGYFVKDVIVTISDIRIPEGIIKETGIDREVVMRSTQDPTFDLFSRCGLGARAVVERIADFPRSLLEEFGMEKLYSYLLQVEERAVRLIREKYPWIELVFNLGRTAGVGYYESFCFKISARTNDGISFPLADGGLTDWTKKLLANQKERLFISGFGTELFCNNFAATRD